MTDTRFKIAVFIDFDNIEIGVKSTLGGQFDVGVVLEALKERGEVVSKTAYGDWKRAGDHSRSLTQHAIKMVQRNLTPGGDKNGADINLALDALEMAFTHVHINAFVIVGGDSDFISLVEKLKQYDKKVFVVGGRAFTSGILQRNCHEFIAYENLIGAPASRRPAERGRSIGQAPVVQAFPLVRRALKLLADREVSPQLGLLKSTLVQLDSTFSERNYGSSTFRDFAEKLAATGLVNLKHSGRNLQVELKDGDSTSGDASIAVEASAPASSAIAEQGEATASAAADGDSSAAAADTARPSDGLRQVRELLEALKTMPRWPMYVRQVKQMFRGLDRTFDERRFGFGSIVDLLRSSQRDGLFRLERDRQGVMRVFPGSSFPHLTAVSGPQARMGGVQPSEIDQMSELEPVEPDVHISSDDSLEATEREPAADEPVGEPEAAVKPKRRGSRSGGRSSRKAAPRARSARARVPRD